VSNGRFPIDWKWKRYHFAKENLLRLRMTFHVHGCYPEDASSFFEYPRLVMNSPSFVCRSLRILIGFTEALSPNLAAQSLSIYNIYDLVFRVPTPPHCMGPQVAPPFLSICKLLAAFLRSSLVFARSLQHFWLPASHLLGTCYLLDDLRSTPTR